MFVGDNRPLPGKAAPPGLAAPRGHPRNTALGRHFVGDAACVSQVGADERKNGILARLPAPEFERLRSCMHLLWVPKGEVLCESGVRQTHVYFPVSAIVSLVYVTESGASTEMASVGRDGLVGIGLFLGGNSTLSQAVVQHGGSLYRMPAAELNAAFERGGAVQHLLLRYTQALLTQVAQTAVCNRHHTLYEQLCRRLLLHLDMGSGREILMTQESMAQALGVRREGVTAAAGRLKEECAIDYERGRITVLNRGKLEAGACECYALVKRENERLLPPEIAI